MVYRYDRPTAACLAILLGHALAPAQAWGVESGPEAAQQARAAQPQLMLAKVWTAGRSPEGFLVSEKLDGVRAFWDGQHLRFRSGLPIAAPGWFTAALPRTPLDGELWLGRGQFERLSGIARRREPAEAEWRELRYMIFDLPGASAPFAERAQLIEAVVQAAGQPWLQAVAQQRVDDAAGLQTLLQQVTQEGGEGLVLHHAHALWSPGRNDALLKYKPVPDDDARVVGHLPGKGRHAGRLGALLLEMPDGRRFALGTGLSDAERDAPPPIGAVVTYRYSDRTDNGLPRFATFVRVRGPE